MARFLITMHMPTGTSENLVHQVIGDSPEETLGQFCDALNDSAFIVVRQYYFMNDRRSGERGWRDRGELILNTNHIGKVSVYYDPTENKLSQ